MNQETGAIGLATPPQPAHLRQLLGITEEYVGYCREERNFAAVLYHLLLDANRLKSFLELIGQPAVEPNGVHIYFEYAHLRDLWAEVACREETVAVKNGRYRAAILSLLGMQKGPELPSTDTGCRAFNAFFTGPRARAASDKHIQMPSRWSDSQFNYWREVHGPEFAARACSLKWAFNAKPDLVLHLGQNKAICIEAKLESGVGRYQVKSDSNPKGCFGMGQLELQEFILKELLGYDIGDKDFVVISKKRNREEGDSTTKWRGYSWQEVFAKLLREHPPTDVESPMVKLFSRREIDQP